MKHRAQMWVVLLGSLLLPAVAKAADKPAPTGGRAKAVAQFEQLYIERVLDQINVAREIRAGRGNQLADRIEHALPRYLKAMRDFKDSRNKNAAYYNAAQHLKSVKVELAPDVRALVDQYSAKVSVVRDQGCYALTDQCGDENCVAVPTSLRPIDPNTPDPNGWQCSDPGSHCGASKNFPYWPCGQCLGLIPCTGSGGNSSGGNSSGGNSSGGNSPGGNSPGGNSSSGNSSNGTTQSGGQGNSNRKAH